MSRNRKKKQSRLPILLTIGGGVLLILAALLLGARPQAQQPVASGPIASSHEEETFPEIPRVSLAESKAAYDAGAAVFIDTRDADSYAAGHIPGAINIPLAELPQGARDLDRSQWIITYCT